MLQWQFFEQYQVEPSIAVVRFLIAFSGEAEQHARRSREQTRTATAHSTAMERHLAGRTFLVGERYTLADISLYAYTHVAHEGELRPRAVPRDSGWLDRVAAQPGTSRSTRERPRPRPLRTEPDGIAPSRQRAQRRRQPDVRRRARRRARAAHRRHGSGADRRRRRGGDPRRSRAGSESTGTKGPVRQSERARPLRARRGAAALGAGRVRDADGSIRLDGIDARSAPTGRRPTSSRPSSTISISGSRTSSAAPTTGRTRRCSSGSPARSAASCPRSIHHGLLLGEDGKKLSKRAGHASVADLRDGGHSRRQRCARTSTSSGCPRTTSSSTIGRIAAARDRRDRGDVRRRARRAADAPLELARALRGARTLVEAREIARQILDPAGRGARRRRRGRRSSGSWSSAAQAADHLDEAAARADRPRAEGGRWQPARSSDSR